MPKILDQYTNIPSKTLRYYYRYKERDKEKLKQRQKDQYKKHKYQRVIDAIIDRQNFRYKLIKLLGGKCVRCGFIDFRALQIDHVNGNGREHSKRYRNAYGMYRAMYKEILNGSKEYQCLCSNCNWIKRAENKEY
jgi:hypothetical protein